MAALRLRKFNSHNNNPKLIDSVANNLFLPSLTTWADSVSNCQTHKLTLAQ